MVNLGNFDQNEQETSRAWAYIKAHKGVFIAVALAGVALVAAALRSWWLPLLNF